MKTNLFLAASITAFLSGCGGGSTPAAIPAATIESSSMTLPSSITLAKDTTSANLAAMNYAAFNDATTDYSKQSQSIWVNDSDYEALNILNGVMKIMTFTQASEMANNGTYKIIYTDPFEETTSSQSAKTTAYVKVTRADNLATTPLMINFMLPETEGSDNTTRLVTAEIKEGISDNNPLGTFTMNMILLDDADYSATDLATWVATAKANNDPFYEEMIIKISPDATTANQSNVQFDMTMVGGDFEYDSSLSKRYNKMHLGANLVTTGAMDSGHGWLLKELGHDDDVYKYFDELYPAFDDKYIADRVGRTVEDDQGAGKLSFRSSFTERHYRYKLFDTNGANLDNGTNISAFGFNGGVGEYGWIGANYNETSNSSTSSEWSAKYYYKEDLTVGQNITDYNTNNIYEVTAVDAVNNFVDLKDSSDNQVNIGGWNDVDLDGDATTTNDIFYKNTDMLFPKWSNSAPNQITGTDASFGGVSYKVKPTLIQKNRALAGNSINEGEDADYAELKNIAGLDDADTEKVEALTDKLNDSFVTGHAKASGLDALDPSILENTYTWYKDEIRGKEATISLKVSDGVVLSTD
jgi:hypothetical protein